jgi:hypothetical protein
MFEIGAQYSVYLWSPGKDGGSITGYHRCTVLEVSMPLIKLRQADDREQIVNTASHAFVQATKQTEAASSNLS